MDAKKTLRKLRGESDRKSFSFYLSETIMTEFREACGEINASRVAEQLMRDFLDDYSKRSQAQVIKKALIKKS